MDFAASLLSFLMLTHIYDFDNHSNGYDCLKDSTVWSFSGLPEIRFFDGFNSDLVPETMRIMTFSIIILLSRLGSLMICTPDLCVLTKRK
jgi:hypothetical protein